MRSIFLTGSTGLVGRYLLCGLLQAGFRVATLVRRGKLETAEERLDAVMRHWEREAGFALPRPIVLEGDLSSEQLGLTAERRRWLAKHCDTVLHCGASMVFRENDQGEPFRTNVGGAENLLDVCRELGIRRFHHISTAYVCGLREGRILETEVDVGQKLGNVYEESKLRAEKLVRQAEFLDEVTIYRPASVVGDSRTGYVTSCHGFYLPLQLAHIVANKVHVQNMNERFMSLLGLKGDEGKNLVPVDWLAKAVVAIVSNPALHGQTYHLASEQPVAVSTIQQIIQDAIETYHPNALRGPGNEDLSAYEALFQEYMRIYQSHWRDDPKFDATNTKRALSHLPCPKMDYHTLMRIARYPIERNFKFLPYEKTEPVFDVATHLHGLVKSGGVADAFEEESFNFQVNGSGGGQWQVSFRGKTLCKFEPGTSPHATAKCYMTTATFRSLVERQRTIEQSIDTGRIVLESGYTSRERLTDMLMQLIMPNEEALVFR